MPDTKEFICPDCGARMTEAAVAHYALPVSIARFHDVEKKRTIERNIDVDNKTWLDAYVCPECGTVKLKAHQPEVFQDD